MARPYRCPRPAQPGKGCGQCGARRLAAGGPGSGLELSFPTELTETAGAGITGLVGGRRVRLGRVEWIARGTAQEEEAFGMLDTSVPALAH